LKSTVISHDIPTAKSKAILLYKSLSQTHTDTHTTGQKQLKIPTAATATAKKA
jgi:hypothetical protein